MENSSKENTQLFLKNAVLSMDRSSSKSESSASKEKATFCGGIKIFLGALSFVYFAKALSGSYLKSTITQIERRFDIPSSLVGLIDGSFEIGNLLIIILVSYFGAKLHRPKIIGAGCLIMSLGTFIIAMPHFFMGHYRYEIFSSSSNSTVSISPCLQDRNQITASVLEKSQGKIYAGCVQTVAIIGPIFGFLLGSLCAKLYVDIGFVDMESITITHKDSQWVGAWWLGYIIAGSISVVAAIPFWFLPKDLPRPEARKDSSTSSEQSKFITDDNRDHHVTYPEQVKILEMAKDFLPSLKSLFGNPVYFLYLCSSVIQFNSLIGMVTYKPKYIEQQFGQSSTKTNFVIGLINIPAVALGIFSGGLIMKKFRLNVLGAARLSLAASFFGYLLLLLLFAMGCKNADVAGLTISYQGHPQASRYEPTLFSECNLGCICSKNEWDPICGENGITYISACLAGCKMSNGSGKSMVFYNCSCVEITEFSSRPSSAVVGPCQNGKECPQMFLYFLVISVITSYTLSIGGTPGYILLLRCINPQLKSFALGIYTLAIRVLAGIPAPVYFGVSIDTTCLKWGSKRCGGQGACRLYDSNAFRYIYLGLTIALGTMSTLLSVAVLIVLKKRYIPHNESIVTSGQRGTTSAKNQTDNFVNSDHLIQTTYWPEKETRL
ncbi:solute carrier organic anion transporter family member 1C1 isoform X2 [Eublepharis macularius]|uniref:Solute carrier organic anion transporter family member n=1 Tax=Eublepharis macularius TaxID=481883 RepID=A0AA97JV69_EUBMA|nr:solute carrier organic anion transporter family member 1C1 isoform X2 [Eublepharis macularius]